MDAGWGGKKPGVDNKHGWSARIMWAEDNDQDETVTLKLYLYHYGQSGSYGDNIGSVDVSTNTWHRIQLRAKVNSTANCTLTPINTCNGIVKWWVNGTVEANETDIKLIDSNTVKVSSVWADNYYGGAENSPVTQYIHFDKVKAADSEISAKAIALETASLPTSFTLEQNYPNPFNPSTRIQYSISEPGPVTLQVYNTVGQVVKTLVGEFAQVGAYEIQWDGKDSNFQEVTNGVYFYQMKAGDFMDTKKMILVK